MLTASLAAATLAPMTLGQTSLALSRVRIMPFRIVGAAGSPVGNLVALAGEDGSVHLVDATNGLVKRTLKGHPQPCYGVAFSPDGKLLVSGDDTARLWLWDAATGAKIREFPREKGHKRGVQSISFTPDGKKILTVGKDDVVMVWNVSGGHPVQTVPSGGANFYGARVLKSGSWVAGTLAEGARLYAPNSASPAATMRRPQGAGSNDIAVNQAETRLFTAGRDGKITAWDLKTRASVLSFQAHDDWVIFTSLAPSGKVIASSSNDRTIKFWNTATGTRLTTLEEMSSVGSPLTWTGNGKYFVGANSADQAVIYGVNPPQPGVAAAPKKPVKKAIKKRKR